MSDEPDDAGNDHDADPELVGIYELLEAEGKVTPGDERTVTEQLQ